MSYDHETTVLQAVLDAIKGTLDPHTQIADHPNVKFAQMQRLKWMHGDPGAEIAELERRFQHADLRSQAEFLIAKIQTDRQELGFDMRSALRREGLLASAEELIGKLARALVVLVLLAGTAWAEDPKPKTVKTGEPVSMAVAMSGIVIVGAGFGMMLHETGACYCQSDTKWIVAGTVVVAAGVTMTWLGLRSRTVTVAPLIVPHVKAVSTTIRWGGRDDARHR